MALLTDYAFFVVSSPAYWEALLYGVYLVCCRGLA